MLDCKQSASRPAHDRHRWRWPFDAHPAIETFLHLDERCASFFALGMAQASGRPVALVCTSGTAAVEFHAAAVEAQMAGVPLLLLTADRPPELRHSGANQTIDQVKMYGDHVLWAVDAALPQDDAPEVALRNLRTLAARAYDVADGLRKGPVHVNLPSVNRWNRLRHTAQLDGAGVAKGE